MVDILHYGKPHNWAGTAARVNDYVYCYDPNERQAKQPATKRCGRPPTTYNYTIKIVHDPLDCGAFAPGREFSYLEHDAMLLNCAFTDGTLIMEKDILWEVYTYTNYRGNQRQKKRRVA